MLAAMSSPALLKGRMRGTRVPDWRSLETLLGSDELCAHFMWMFDVELEDGTVLDAYKHRWTRCYFHLAKDGRAFYYVTDDLCAETDGLYAETDPYRAIKAVFADWESCKPTPEQRRALRAALRRAAALAEPD
jgi:hypothetical protein